MNRTLFARKDSNNPDPHPDRPKSREDMQAEIGGIRITDAFLRVSRNHELGEVVIFWPEQPDPLGVDDTVHYLSNDHTLRLHFIGEALDEYQRAYAHELIIASIPCDDDDHPGRLTFTVTDRRERGSDFVIETMCPIEASLRAIATMRSLRGQSPVAPPRR